jgi:CheY-like chemotaxis protein
MSYKLLLADDSVTIQRVIELTFADEDVEVTAVGDGQMAIDRLEADPPDIILADVDMPKRDGYEVAAYVKSRPKLAHIPVVLLTGAFEPIDSARAAAAGSSDVLAKPFEPQMVINRVKELLGRKRQDDQYAAEPVAQVHTTAPAALPAPPRAESSPPLSLDDYFDQLDAAFSNLQPGAPTAAESSAEMDWAVVTMPEIAEQAPAPDTDDAVPMSSAVVADEAAEVFEKLNMEWATVEASPVPTLPDAERSTIADDLTLPDEVAEPVVPYVAEPAARPTPAPQPVAAMPEPVGAMPEPVAALPQPAKSNPFANLSAAKAEAAARAAAAVVTEELIEDIVTRVLQRMSDKVVRETVTGIVSETAERLVQEEIERIKSSGS